MDEGETPEQAAIREAMEELGVEVAIRQKVAVIHFDQSTQVYFLVDRVRGKFGTGTGEEFTDSDPNDPQEGVYIPIWMPIDELPRHAKVFPEDLAKLVIQSNAGEWSKVPIVVYERSK